MTHVNSISPPNLQQPTDPSVYSRYRVSKQIWIVLGKIMSFSEVIIQNQYPS